MQMDFIMASMLVQLVLYFSSKLSFLTSFLNIFNKIILLLNRRKSRKHIEIECEFKNCEIKSKHRLACSYCRYQKCLNMGNNFKLFSQIIFTNKYF